MGGVTLQEVPKPPAGWIPLAKPFFDETEEREVLATLRSGWVAQGPRVADFEAAIAEYVGAREAVAVSSGTAALFLLLHSLGIGPGDEVVVPSLSFIASANAVVHCGATPVFVDVDSRSYNIDPEQVARALTSRTRAVMVVHQLGLPADLDAIHAIAQRQGIAVVEDAACALGSRYKNKPIGGQGTPACFSFHPRKVISTGEGGMITTDDPQLAVRLRRLRHQGMTVSDLERQRHARLIVEEYPEVGYNFRLSDLHASLGLAQLPKLAEFLRRRRSIAVAYDEAFSQLSGIETPFVPDFATPNYQSYAVRLVGVERSGRDQVINALGERGIAVRPGVMAAHRESCYATARRVGELPNTEAATDQTAVLPVFPGLDDDELRYVIEQFSDVVPRVLAQQ
ncbi:MAG: DegT/DnrJ/EryC1/StrS family aminotransferase [bacterium]|nr:DegT/DnrJ/EryC1/StrS family aminotransferase [bacterium]